jgi:hypothetical protein
MSDSPWDAQAVFRQIQEEIATRADLKEGFLTLDENGDERDGDKSTGAARQCLEESLLIALRNNGEVKFSVGNAPVTTPCEELGRWRCQRYFVERVFQDAKSDHGKPYNSPLRGTRTNNPEGKDPENLVGITFPGRGI